MRRIFNTAGPCDPARHYMLPPEDRLPDVRRLVDRQEYFVLHAPRQTGKTTAFLRLAEALNREGRYVAAMLSVEVGAAAGDDAPVAEAAILDDWALQASAQLPLAQTPPATSEAAPLSRLGDLLTRWSRHLDRPLVLFIDEIDALSDAALMTVLRQLRSGFPRRSTGSFPVSVGVFGMRDVRDYKFAAGAGGRLGGPFPFNIARSFRMRDFSRDEVADLLAQHTGETGQPFEAAAIEALFEQTRGQPWLVNAVAAECVETRDTDAAIDRQAVLAAVDRVLVGRPTHLDSLAERLRDDRIRAVLVPMLTGAGLGGVDPDDVEYAADLGLVRPSADAALELANPMYTQVVERTLEAAARRALPRLRPAWLDEQGELDLDGLLAAFLAFWRQHSEAMMRAEPYHEFAPHLVLMAFLHRVVNGGGHLQREDAIGWDRLDLRLQMGDVDLPIEVKVWRPDRRDPLQEGLDQLDGYLKRLALDFGWLVIFDRRPDAGSLADRLATKEERTPSSRRALVIRA